jgi:hypothetical protein
MIFIVHTMPRRWVYLKMGLPDAYRKGEEPLIGKTPRRWGQVNAAASEFGPSTPEAAQSRALHESEADRAVRPCYLQKSSELFF